MQNHEKTETYANSKTPVLIQTLIFEQIFVLYAKLRAIFQRILKFT